MPYAILPVFSWLALLIIPQHVAILWFIYINIIIPTIVVITIYKQNIKSCLLNNISILLFYLSLSIILIVSLYDIVILKWIGILIATLSSLVSLANIIISKSGRFVLVLLSGLIIVYIYLMLWLLSPELAISLKYYITVFINNIYIVIINIYKNINAEWYSTIKTSLSSIAKSLPPVPPLDFDFTAFYHEYAIYYHGRTLPSYDDLTHFIGYAEANMQIGPCSETGLVCFSVAKIRWEDTKYLNDLVTILPFGHGTSAAATIAFKVSPPNIYLLVLLLNGNLVLPKSKRLLSSILSAINRNLTANKQIVFNDREIKPSLSNAWLSGIIEGDGSLFGWLSARCFFIRITLSQVGLIDKLTLSYIGSLFLLRSCVFKKPDIKGSWMLCVSGLKNIKLVLAYLDKFPFKGVKHDSYLKFKVYYSMLLEKKHLDRSSRSYVENFALHINPERKKKKK